VNGRVGGTHRVKGEAEPGAAGGGRRAAPGPVAAAQHDYRLSGRADTGGELGCDRVLRARDMVGDGDG